MSKFCAENSDVALKFYMNYFDLFSEFDAFPRPPTHGHGGPRVADMKSDESAYEQRFCVITLSFASISAKSPYNLSNC